MDDRPTRPERDETARPAPSAEVDSGHATGVDADGPGNAQARAGGRVRRVARAAGRTLLALTSAVALTATGIAWSTAGRFNENVTTTNVLDDIPNSGPEDDGATDILLVGNDSRTDAQGNPLPQSVLELLRTESTDTLNTDTLILLRVPHNGGRAHAVSIPRDTYVPIPNYREDKINAAYGATKFRVAQRMRDAGERDEAKIATGSDQEGRRALVQAVQELTGSRVDHYAEVNLYGFYLLTEALGGVEVCLNQATSDPNSGASFRAGNQTISGGDALAFVRQRHGLPRGDLDRIVRQQAFMASAANRVLSSGTLTDRGKLDGLLQAAQKSVVIDERWDVLRFAQRMQEIAGGSVRFVTIPVEAVGARNERGQNIITVDREKVHRFVAGLARGAAAEPARPGASTSSPAAAPGTDRLTGPRAFRPEGEPVPKSPAPPAGEPITTGGVPCVN
ncbi:LytTR family transcriptional regulator [Longimycelium tulufanense]|uniref:LytTR family transcriptional regulator n=1 Tax=Longimycelium tulufanense TaxID=907463 RepID=A0A8J3FVU0_9PSEU|nr:LCP family protein [Longimycelium tulufanense]GGM66279.1 LytTR family transcriptional regulator [Longimycelium tulufanense]